MTLDRNYTHAAAGSVVKARVQVSSAGTKVRIKIYNLTGEIIRRMDFDAPYAGLNEFTWDVKNDAGKYVGRGMYFIYIEANGSTAVRRVYILK